MYVDDKKVEPVDILFATPGMRGFKDPMNDQSVKIEDKEWYDEKTQEITDHEGNKQEIHIRWSRLPTLFFIRNQYTAKLIIKPVNQENL